MATKTTRKRSATGVREEGIHCNSTPFPVVAIAAPATNGSLEELVRSLPADGDVATIVFQHETNPALAQSLAAWTSLPVRVARNDHSLEPNTVFVMSGNLCLEAATFRENGSSTAMPLDAFLSCVADGLGARAIAVVLGGSGTDGALGARAVKAAGGLTFSEEGHASELLAASGSIDFTLPPAAIAQEIRRLSGHLYLRDIDGSSETPILGRGDELKKIFALLQTSHDIDLSHYKPATIGRRIHRRMAVNRISDIGEYVEFVRANPGELDALYEDVLIRVTSFFRDPDVFDYLKSELAPRLLASASNDSAIRVWVPGCATGEECYSIAIVLLEVIEDLKLDTTLQIFGTDVSEHAVERARVGLYPENIAAEVSPERLRRFFVKVDGQYRIAKPVRDLCIFARQNVTKDPPFSKVDLISCRNLLIYLGAFLQSKVLSMFHYALRPDGLLLLGNSETIGNFGELFTPVDRRHKVYGKKPGSVNRSQSFAFPAATAPPARRERGRSDEEGPGQSLLREADRIVLARYSPVGVVVNEELQIVQFRGRTSAFLEPAAGAASFDLLKMAREGLLSDLRTSLHKAKATDARVRREGITISAGSNSKITASVEVIPFTSTNGERYFIVSFEEMPALEKEKAPKKAGRENGRETSRLAAELDATREYLQSVIEEQEAMNEELRSANEEIQSANEELQSTNEELETAKEELQSSNEELTTLNEELESRNSELALLNSDLVNLLGSIDIPILMLGNDLRIRRFNPAANRTLNLLGSDVGRPIGDLKLTLHFDGLETMISGVIESLAMQEVEVQNRDGRWFLLRVRPYRTIENKIDGAVLTLIDVDTLKQGQSAS